MHCIPEQKKKTVVNLVFAVFAALAAVMFSLAVVCRATDRHGLCILSGLLAMLFTVAALFVLMRYRFLGFVYVIKPRDDRNDSSLVSSYASLRDVPYFLLDLVVLKKVGLREERVECVLSLEGLKETAVGNRVRDVKRQMREKYADKIEEKFIIYDYTLTPGTEDAVGLVFLDGERYVGVLLEADERLLALFDNI